MTDSIPPQKQCSKCKEFFPATKEYFHLWNRSKDGLKSACKKCRNNDQWIYGQSHKEQEKAHNKQWRESHPEEVVAYSKVYRQTHKDEIAAYKKADYESSRETILARISRYKQTHKDTVNSQSRNRKARKRKNGGTHTAQDIQKQYASQKGKCYYAACGHATLGKKYHVDHIVPLSRGGSNDPANLVLTCPTCNLVKHDKLPHEWPEGGRLM